MVRYLETALNWSASVGMVLISVSVGSWLVSFLNAWGMIVASFVGVSVILVNYQKFRSVMLGNELKEIRNKRKKKK